MAGQKNESAWGHAFIARRIGILRSDESSQASAAQHLLVLNVPVLNLIRASLHRGGSLIYRIDVPQNDRKPGCTLPHQGLDNELIVPLLKPPNREAAIVATERLGGLFRSYRRAALFRNGTLPVAAAKDSVG